MNLNQALLIMGSCISIIGILTRVRYWIAGSKETSLLSTKERCLEFIDRVFTLRHLKAGGWRAPLMHSLLLWGALGLCLSLIYGATPSLRNINSIHAQQTMLLIREISTFFLLYGIGMATYRRFIKRWKRLPTDLPGDGLILTILFATCITGIFTVGTKLRALSLEDQPLLFLGHIAAILLDQLKLEQPELPVQLFTIHIFLSACLIAIIPWTRLRHILFAPMAILFAMCQRGQSVPSVSSELSWALRMQLDACSGCGRCDQACPPRSNGSLISPMQIIFEQRNDPRAIAITSESLSTCTLCNICEEVCPIGISHTCRLDQLKKDRGLSKQTEYHPRLRLAQ